MNADKYMDLFVHRCDVFAEQQSSGAYYPVEREFTEDELDEHLAGVASYGTYVIKPGENTVKYVVFDLDVQDEQARDALCSLVQDMLVKGTGFNSPASTVLEWSGNKGWHVWLFLTEPIDAGRVRRWVARDFMPEWQKVAEENGWPQALEVFPKQDAVAEGGYGNLVKLPLGKHAVSGNFSTFASYMSWPIQVNDIQPLDSALVPDVAPSLTPTARRRSGGSRPSAGGPATPFPCVDRIMREGVPQGYRNNAMFHLALYLYGHGLDEDLALEVCTRSNEEFDPPFGVNELARIVSSAYSGRYEAAACGKDWLAEICPGPCWSGRHVKWNPAESGALHRAEPGATVEVSVVEVAIDGKVKRLRLAHPDASNRPTLVVGKA